MFRILLLAVTIVVLSESERRRLAQKNDGQIISATSMFQRLRQNRVYRWIVKAIELTGSIVVFAIAIAGTFGPFWPTQPKLEATGNDFALPFRVTNTNSYGYAVRVINFSCALGGTDPKNPRNRQGYNFLTKEIIGVSIAPKGIQNFSCEGAYLPGFEVNAAQMWIGLKFQPELFGHEIGAPRGIADMWTFEHGTWVEGDIR